MLLKSKAITKGFIVAGMMNCSVLIWSRLFTNPTIPEFDSEVMSNFGLLMICVWGITYMSVAKNYENVKWLIGVFAFEKFIYGYVWTNWMLNHSISEVFEKDLMAGVFYAIYGINDWFFCIFFSLVFFRLLKGK